MVCVLSRLQRVYRDIFHAPARDQASDYSIALPLPSRTAPDALRVAVMIHMFHAEMAAEFRSLIDRSVANADILISTETEAKRRIIADAFAGSSGRVEIRLVENRGRDILPKLTSFTDRYANYDLILFLHSKKSLHVTSERDWRTFLLDHLIGSPTIVSDIREIFAANPDIGMVFPQHFEPLRRFIAWGAHDNYPAALPMIERLGVKMTPRMPLDFPSGSMFWCRPAALGPLLDLGLRACDFPDEEAQTDGTLGHAVERLFLASVEKAGYHWLKIAIPDHFTQRATIMSIEGPHAVPDFLRRYGFRVTGEAG